MSAPVQVDPQHNINALMIGTPEFSFSLNAVSVADARAKGYRDFGNIVSVTPNFESTKNEHFGSYRGVRRKDKTLVTDSKLEYTIVCDQLDENIIQYLYAATAGTNFTQSALTSQAIDGLTFSGGSPSDPKVWYDITVSGARVAKMTDLTLTGKTQGTDYRVDAVLGRVQFITTQTAAVAGTVSAPAITSADPDFYKGFKPQQDLSIAGFGRLVFFDQNDTNKRAIDHQDFSCEVSFDSSGAIDGQNVTEYTLRVTVTDTVGNLLVRNANTSLT